MLEVKLLGQFEIALDGQSLEIPSRPAQSLLAFLMLNRGAAHRREKLAGLLWPDSSESNARNNLRQALWRIRKMIGDGYLVADKVSVSFSAEKDYWLDAQILETAAGGNAPVEVLERAVSVYEGELLPGFYDQWVTLERERLQALFEQRIHGLSQLLVEDGRWDDVTKWAERWISLGQAPEPAYRALMTAAAGRGDQAGVVAAFHRCVEALEEEVGVEPSPETLDIFEKLTSGEIIFQAQKTYTNAGPSVKLPLQMTPFIGREEERARLTALLEDAAVKVITVLGPGGMGKTRLAIEAAGLQAEAFSDGVYFINLASIDDAGLITSQIGDTLNFQFHHKHKREQWEYDTQIEQLLAYLKEKQLLLLLDNSEHLLTTALPSLPAWDKSVDQLVADIVRTAPQVKILATSRERLHLHGETVLPLGGLDFPASAAIDSPDVPDFAAYDAIQLFREGVRRARPDFELDPDNLADVVDICRLVGGMPLAIELSSAWVELLSPPEIAAEIRSSLDFLETDLGNIPDRQRSVRLVFESTWDRLAPTEQEVFQQLSVFRGGFTREAAQAVTGTSLRTLRALVNKSLLRPDLTGRYQLHELLRQFAAEHLAQDPVAEAAVKDRHCAYFSSFLLKKEPVLRGPSQGEALTDIEAEIDNVRPAWRWAVAHENYKEIEKAMESMAEYLRIRGRLDEAYRFFQPAAASLGWGGFGRPEDIPDSDITFNDMMRLLDRPPTRAENGNERQLALAKILARDNRQH
jgi:DNA-binding SARP family transcriptional activator/predicted ATPase